MKQYCRYCSNFCCGNGEWCEEFQKTLSESYAKRPNNCKKFNFCSIDAYDSTREYKPRKKSQNDDGDSGQQTLF